MIYLVITKVPPPGDRGNLATSAGQVYLDPQYRGGGIDWDVPLTPLGEELGNPMLGIYVQVPVFAVGEVLITEDGERECVGAGRKPSKWDVQFESFESVEEAVARAQAVNHD